MSLFTDEGHLSARLPLLDPHLAKEGKTDLGVSDLFIDADAEDTHRANLKFDKQRVLPISHVADLVLAVHGK